tara:strand:+ start:217 stop:960 length:744 start_codon:yes stop_codon:yes gene_type:complete
MRETIERIVNIAEILEVSSNQSLFLLAHKYGMRATDISTKDLTELVNRGYIDGQTITELALSDIDLALAEEVKVVKKKKKRDTTLPILTKETGQLVKLLSKRFLNTSLTAREFDRLLSYNKNHVAIPFMYIFLQMFPSADAKKNKVWNKVFKTTWTGVTLRRMTVGTSKKLKKIWETKDQGIFLLGTFLFIQQSYSSKGDAYFIKSIAHYLDEWENWYNDAEDRLLNGEFTEFTKVENVAHNNSYAV